MMLGCYSRGISEKLKQDPFSSILLIMNGFVLLSAGIFIGFTYQIIDDGLCDATQLPGLHRDLNEHLRYAKFIEHFYHILDVPKIEGVEVQTGRHCLPRCVKNDRCFFREHWSISFTKRKYLVWFTSNWQVQCIHEAQSESYFPSLATALWWVLPLFILIFTSARIPLFF